MAAAVERHMALLDAAIQAHGGVHSSSSPLAKAFDGIRKPLVGEFTCNGHTLFVIGNPWTSKQADDPLFGRHQPAELVSETKRVDQAARVRQSDHDPQVARFQLSP